MSAPSHSGARGFYVFQAALGSPLQFHPALGTSELDSLMDAYLPSPASIKEKRASISVDFFDHFRLTGESIKFYQVPNWVNSTTSSPNSTQDSGYGSSFTASPLAPTWSWGPLDHTAASTPSTSSSVSTPRITSRRREQSSSSRQSGSSRAGTTNFSNLPGMKILTRDGRDVTNTATRGCKTKEQRDHAHLMRIMKACDSCKKKKVRCDPSHRTRASPVSPVDQPARSAKKARISAPQYKPEMAVSSFEPAILEDPTSLPSLPTSFEFDTFDFLNETPIDEQANWDEFLRYNGELDSVFPDGLGNLPDLETFSSAPPRRPVSRSDPSNAPVVLAQEDVAVHGVPKLPYLDKNDEPHHYVDFNLYSPSSSFSDTEPSVSPDLVVDSVSRSQAIKQQVSGVGVDERVARPTVHRPEGCSDIQMLDHSQSPSSRPQIRPSGNFEPISLDEHTCVSQQIPPSSPPSLSREVLPSTNLGPLHTKTNDGQALRDDSTWSPALHVSRTALESSVFREATAVSGGQSPALPGDSTRLQPLATLRQGDATVVAFATQAAAADLQRPGTDVVLQSASSEDECGSREVIDPHRSRRVPAEPHVSRTTEANFTLLKSTAGPVMESSGSGDKHLRLENRHLAAVSGRATLDVHTTQDVVSASSLKPTARTSVQEDSGTAQAASLSCHVSRETELSTMAQSAAPTSPQDLLSVATAVVDLTLATALSCMALSSHSSEMVPGASGSALWTALCTIARQSEDVDGSGSSPRKLRTGHAVSRMETALSRVPVLV